MNFERISLGEAALTWIGRPMSASRLAGQKTEKLAELVEKPVESLVEKPVKKLVRTLEVRRCL